MTIPMQKALLPALISSALMISGCGSDSDSSNTPSGGNLTSGIITGFGSVYVNGIRFDTDSSSFDVDDDSSASQDDLRVGMLVQVDGSINPDGVSGTATSIFYDNEVEGPVSNIDISDPANIIITILGRDITVTADTQFDNDDNDLDMTLIAVGDLLEVSGYRTDSGIIATHIELQSDDFIADLTEVEIKGEIEVGSLGADSFTIDGLAIQFDGSTELEDIPSGSLSEGLYVEVKGTLNAAGDLLSASEIEAEDDGLEDDADEVYLAGVIYGYDSVAQTFMLQGVSVDASQAPELEPSNLVLANELEVKVEGSLVNGVLIADEIELHGRKIEVDATITDISANPADANDITLSFSLFGGSNNISVRVNQQTDMEDDVGALVPFNPSDLAIGDYVKLEAYDDGSGVINATELDRKASESVELQGPISGYDEVLQTVTMFGQTFDLSNAEYEGANDLTIDAATFYAALANGALVELVDEDPADGVIDKAELED
ncbi:MAG: DUF5666 domain-containing protein [Gammaproteobacteria bacterium]|nr:DUF5666 domain-containing protein [Gammaproteobacteria bacterium]